MEYILTFFSQFSAIDWVSFAAAWFLIEKSLKVLAKITPWQWDDDLIEWISKFISSIAPKKNNPS